MNWVSAAGLLAFCLLTPALAAEDSPDHLALAAVLLRDGHPDRAATALGEVDLEAEETDLLRFHTLSAMVALERQLPAVAEAALGEAGQVGAVDPKLWLALAQVYFATESCPGAVGALDQAGAAADARPAAWRMRVDCARKADDIEGAWGALEAGVRAHPADVQLGRLKVLLLVELGFARAAAAEGKALLGRIEATADDYVILGEAMRRARLLPEALLLLEEGRLRFPNEPRVTQALARALVDSARPYAAAGLFAQLAWTQPERAADAAELYRRAGALGSALRMNARAPDPAARAKQRLGLLVQAERFEAAYGLRPRLSRLGLLAHDDVRYALAYSAWQAGRAGEVEGLLRGIYDSGVFRKAADLRQAMSACQKDPGRCL